MRAFQVALTALLAVVLCQPLSAQGAFFSVLRIRSQTRTPQGWVFTLASGATVTVPFEDVDDELVRLLKLSMISQPAPEPGTLPDYEGAMAIIKPKCAKSTNDLMRGLCEQQQRTGLMALRARTIDSDALKGLRTACAKSWPDDFKMRDFCEVQQVESLKAVGR